MKTFKELSEKLVNVSQRKKQARRMAKLAKSPAFQFKKKKALLKMRNPAKLHMAARKKTIQLYRDKFYPSYADMSLQQKVKIDQIIMAKYGSKIDKISKKVAMKLRKTEMERIKQARKNKSDA
jgi:hypothetical protein|tara:strand:+ start:76 stop:444 length:369 start_codon:yes stop_codon:yes gene_type:complete